MDEIDLHEWVSEAVGILDQREAHLGHEYWFIYDGADEGLSYCENCVKGHQPGEWEKWEDYTHAYPAQESDSCARCECCGEMLDCTLTDYGVTYELEPFSEGEAFDWDNPYECYTLARVAHGIGDDDMRSQTLYGVLVNGKNLPNELRELLDKLQSESGSK